MPTTPSAGSTPNGLSITPNTTMYVGHTVGAFQNQGACAAILEDGSVVTWGSEWTGGDSSAVAALLDGSVPVTQVFSNMRSFAALRADGSVVTWGSASEGGDSSAVAGALDGTIDVVRLFSTYGGYAALRADGSVVTWGDPSSDSSAVADQLDGAMDVVQVFTTGNAFAALRADGSVVTWGAPAGIMGEYGADSSAVAGELDGAIDVTRLFSTYYAFAALRADGSVVTWGNVNAGGDSSTVAGELDGTIDVVDIKGTLWGTFAALRADGSVVTWGDRADTALAGEIDGTIAATQLCANDSALAAVRTDGSVVSWGADYWGGDFGVYRFNWKTWLYKFQYSVADQLDGTNDVVQVCANHSAFAALRADGSVVTWGFAQEGGDSRAVADQLDGSIDVVDIVSNRKAFAALRADGSVVTWGDPIFGGNGTVYHYQYDDNTWTATYTVVGSVAALLDGTVDVVKLYAVPGDISGAFIAVRADGSIVAWGGDNSGGDISAVADQLAFGVVGLADATTDDVYTPGGFTNLPTDGGDHLYGSSGDDRIRAMAGADWVNGKEGSDLVMGGGGRDHLFGIGGDDVLRGGTGRDLLDGGAGNDTLAGQAGSDVLAGGAGRDTFLFFGRPEASTSADLILDFTPGEDVIRLDSARFAGLAAGPLSAGHFCANATGTAADADDLLVYDTATGVLAYDADGSGSGASVALFVLGSTDHPALSAADFLIV